MQLPQKSRYRLATRSLLLGFLLFISIAVSAFGSQEFPFRQRLLSFSNQGPSCSGMADASKSNPLRMAEVRQRQLDQVYKIVRPIGGDLGDFLLFISDIQRREFEIEDAILSVGPKSRSALAEQLEVLRDDFDLIRSFISSVESQFPFLKKSLRKFFQILNRSDEMLSRIQNDLSSMGNAPNGDKKLLSELSDAFRGKMSEVVGVFGELQLGFRLQGIQMSSFRLTDLKPDRTIMENARILALPISGVTNLLSLFDSQRLDWSLKGITLVQRRAHYALHKEFDFRQILAPGLENWIEVKNCAKLFRKSDLLSPKGLAIQKQIRNSIIIGDIARRLDPKLVLTLEIHFLQGISKDAKVALEGLFRDQIRVVSGVPD